MTNLSKLEVFNARGLLDRPETVPQGALQDISFYAFWRLFYNDKKRLVRRKREKIVALNGTGWPAQAKRAHPHHLDYARRTLYAYMPCAGLRGTDYIDDVVREYYHGHWGAALAAFVKDPLQKWCPTWIKRNYEALNKDDLTEGRRTAAAGLEATLATTLIFEQPANDVDEETQDGHREPPPVEETALPVTTEAQAAGVEAQAK